MELNINSPSYYKNIYGVDDEIYWMCRSICKFVKDKNYSDIVSIVGICPIVAPQGLIDEGHWKEEIRYDLKYNLVSVSKHINFEEYVNADIEGKKRLIIDNILKSMKSISEKGKIDYEQFEKDILEFIGCSFNCQKNI